MFKQAKPLFFVCETPLHAGSGSDLGIIDLPIQRERHTGFPKIEGSSLKGAIREAIEGVDFQPIDPKKSEKINLAFGPEGNEVHAGALGFSDARLLLFPVKSVKGIFAWITCPKVIEQFKRDLAFADTQVDIGYKNHPSGSTCFTKSKNLLQSINGNVIVLEEYAFKVSPDNSFVTIDGKYLGEWLSELLAEGYWKEKIKTDIVILSNDDFKDFVNLSTEVITRTKINNETGTVQTGALFTEEYLPAESIMYSLVMASPVFLKEEERKKAAFKTEEEVMKYFSDTLPNVIQIGANATLGKGIVRMYKALLTN